MPGSTIKHPLVTEQVFTTGQVARLCTVGSNTVSHWFDSGLLRGYRIPGSRERRIPRSDLVAFLTHYEMPLGDLRSDVRSVLYVGSDPQYNKEAMAEFTFEHASCLFSAGIAFERFLPRCVIVDYDIGTAHAVQLCRSLKNLDASQRPVVIGIGAKDTVHSLGDDFLSKPVDITLLTATIIKKITPAVY